MTTEWLTTGEMIDRLKVGETAELHKDYQIERIGPSYTHIYKDEDGDLLWTTKNKTQFDEEPLQMFGHTCNWKWRILPKYVSFAEAMQALKEGKKVYCEYRNDVCATKKQEIDIRHGGYLPIHAEAIIDGKWTIEDDSDD